MRDEKGRFIKGFHSSLQTEFKKGHKMHLGKKCSEQSREKMKKKRKEWWQVHPNAHNRERNPIWNNGSSHKICYETWEEFWREKVPKSYIIHHVDRDRINNEITNLAMVTRSFHWRIHND